MMQMAGRNAVPLQIPARFMVVSLISLVLWILLTPWMLPRLIDDPISYPVVAWAHLLTIGGIGSMILGASVQLVPVALQLPFPAIRLADWSWGIWLIGIVLFELGFSREVLSLLVPGATLLGIVLIGYAMAMTSMVWNTPHRDAVAWHLLAASWFAVIGFSLGWMLALTNVNGVLGGRLLPILAIHIISMIAGWTTLTLLGVGYKLIGMFTLAERVLNQQRAILSGRLITAGTLATVTSVLFSWPRLLVTISSVLIAVGVIIALIEVTRMYRKRMRRTIDVHMPFALIALSILLASAISLISISFEEVPLANRLTITTVWLVLAGSFLVAIQGFFYKISTFLIWLHTYAPLAGKVAVPQLDRMYDRRLAFIGLGAWMASVIAVALVLLDWLPIWWGWSFGLWAGGLLFTVNVVRIGRHWRGPVNLPAAGVSVSGR